MSGAEELKEKVAELEDRVAVLEDRTVDGSHTVDALWACVSRLSLLAVAARESIGELTEAEKERAASLVGGDTQAEVDVRHAQRLLVAVARKTDLFGDDDFARLFGACEEADDAAR